MRGARSALCVLAVVVVGTISAAPALAAGRADHGSIGAVYGSAGGPWHLRVLGTRNQTVLDEVGSQASATAPGPLGFRVAGIWYHATNVISGSDGSPTGTTEVATNDPAGRTIHVTYDRISPGAVSLSAQVQGPALALVSATGIAFEARPGERYLGFGVRSDAVNQRGNEVRNYVSEGPYQDVEQPAIAALVPSPGVNPRHDATYYPVPWLLSTAGYGVLVTDDTESRFRLGSDSPGAWSVQADGASITFDVFGGPRPADALRRMTGLTGRQPPAAAPFYFGPWFQPSGADAASIDALRAADAPASVGQTYTHYLPCGDQRSKKAAQAERTALFHSAGLAVTTYFNPMICTNYTERYAPAVAAGVLTKRAGGIPYTYNYTGSTIFNVAQFDFTAPGADDYYGDLLSEAVGDGYDGWMEDFGEYTPLDAVSADGTPGPEMHNLYPKLYHRAAYRYSSSQRKPLARFNRSGWTGSARYSQIVWGGDPTTGFGFDGLSSAVTNGLSMGLSGVSLWGSDIGGFFALSSPQTTPELLSRWIEVGFASGVMRTQANGFDLNDAPRAQIFDPGLIGTWRRYAKLRTQLYPYLAAAERAYDATGMPLMRSLALVNPGDPRASAQEDEYMFGPNLLAAPVLSDGARTRSVYLPRGKWVDLWRSTRYVEKTGALAPGRARVLSGGRSADLAAPLEELPLLLRAGTILPMLPADVDTLTAYGNAKGLVHLRDRRRQMTLLAFPRGQRRMAIGRRETVVSNEAKRRWSIKLRGRVTRVYRLRATMSTLARPFRPCRVTLDGRPLRRRAWSYSRRTGALEARFRTRRGRLLVLPCRSKR